MAPECEERQRHGGPALAAASDADRTMQGSSISAVHFEQSAHHGSVWRVSAVQRLDVCGQGRGRTADLDNLPLFRSTTLSAVQTSENGSH